MILFARASTLGGIVRPICFAVFRLMTNSNFVGCSTGRSAGLAPFKNLVDVNGGAPETLSFVGRIGHEAAGLYELTSFGH